MAATKKMPGGGWQAGTGQDKMDCFEDTTTVCMRQLVKIALPWIAAAVPACCSPGGWAGRYLGCLSAFALVKGGRS